MVRVRDGYGDEDRFFSRVSRAVVRIGWLESLVVVYAPPSRGCEDGGGFTTALGGREVEGAGGGGDGVDG